LAKHPLTIAMLSIHSSPIGELGKKDTGGMSVYIRELARALGKRGHRVDIFTRLQDPAWQATVQLYENVRLIHLLAGNGRNLHTLALYPFVDDFCRGLERFRAGEQIQYDLIHSHYWLSGHAGQSLQDCWQVPHMVMFHTLGAVKNIAVPEEQESDLRLAKETELTGTCRRILAATEKEKEHLVRYYRATPEHIGVVPCGVDLERFRPLDRRTVRRELGFEEERPIVLFVGRLAPIKGIDRLLEAMTHLESRLPARLVIIGGDDQQSPESENLRRLSQMLGLRDSVVFLGRVEHERLPPYYCAADVLVLPSHYETFGLVALEALACGTPVVATPVGAMEMVIRQNETGYVAADGDPRMLARGIDTFLARSRTDSWSAAAIRATVLGFGWDSVAASVIEEYQALLRQERGAGAACNSADASALPVARLDG
jgi:D-inositol-3-phosphate glycosyltransferase